MVINRSAAYKRPPKSWNKTEDRGILKNKEISGKFQNCNDVFYFIYGLCKHKILPNARHF